MLAQSCFNWRRNWCTCTNKLAAERNRNLENGEHDFGTEDTSRLKSDRHTKEQSGASWFVLANMPKEK